MHFELTPSGKHAYFSGQASGTGWKIHINVPADYEDPQTKKISDFLATQKVSHKVGYGGGEEDGKGMTVYCGSRRNMESVARLLVEQGFDGNAPKGSTLEDDMPLQGNLMGRFDCGIPQSEAQKWISESFGRYGFFGVQLQLRQVIFQHGQRFEMSNPDGLYNGPRFFDAINAERNLGEETLRRKSFIASHVSLISIFKEFYLGDGFGPTIKEDLLEHLLQRNAVAFGNRRGMSLPVRGTQSPEVWLNQLSQDRIITLLPQGQDSVTKAAAPAPNFTIE